MRSTPIRVNMGTWCRRRWWVASSASPAPWVFNVLPRSEAVPSAAPQYCGGGTQRPVSRWLQVPKISVQYLVWAPTSCFLHHTLRIPCLPRRTVLLLLQLTFKDESTWHGPALTALIQPFARWKRPNPAQSRCLVAQREGAWQPRVPNYFQLLACNRAGKGTKTWCPERQITSNEEQVSRGWLTSDGYFCEQ